MGTRWFFGGRKFHYYKMGGLSLCGKAIFSAGSRYSDGTPETAWQCKICTKILTGSSEA